MIDERDEIVMPDIKQAIFFIKSAWNLVSEEKVVNCWRKTGEINFIQLTM